MDRSIFMKLPTGDIANLIKTEGIPKVGVFVSDGNRRLVLSKTKLQENTSGFFEELVTMQTSGFLNNLHIFFGHGLRILFAPLFSRSVLSRKSNYPVFVALKTLKLLFTDDTWLKFYDTWNVRVKIYGNLAVLSESGCEPALDWIHGIQEKTKTYTMHTLFIGIGGEPGIGKDAAKAAVLFFQKNQREASRAELSDWLYGETVPFADFFIMCSKFAGLGALPGLICDARTESYYLPAPAAISLTKPVYRAILYDLIYLRRGKAAKPYQLSPVQRHQLQEWYAKHANQVIGLGKKIGTVWIPEIFD